MTTMNISEFITVLGEFVDKHGDVPVVLWDMDTGYYFSLSRENIEAQRMEDGSVRASIGPNSYRDPREDYPSLRPLP